MYSTKPLQKTTLSEKLDKDSTAVFPKWIVDNVQYLISSADFDSNREYRELASLYDAAAGYLNSDAYRYVLNPHNVQDEKLTYFPARLKNLSIIKPIVNMFCGEYSEMPDNYDVVVHNSDSKNRMKDSLNQKMLGLLAQDVVNHFNAAGIETGVPSQEVDYKQAQQEHNDNWTDTRAIVGQEALDYLKDNLRTNDRIQDAFKDWIIGGRVVSYKDVNHDDVLYEIVSPFSFWCKLNEKSNFIQDSEEMVRIGRFTLNEVWDRWGDKIKVDCKGKLKDGAGDKDIIDLLEQEFKTGYNAIVGEGSRTNVRIVEEKDNGQFKNNNDSIFKNDIGKGSIYHCVWKTFVKVGILTYDDEFGMRQMIEVDEGYILQPEKGDISIEWEWKTQYWECKRLNRDWYFDWKPCDVQRNEINNTSICHPPYGGRYNIDRLGGIESIVKDGLNYQVLYNIYHYRFEMTVAKNKDKMIVLPLGLIPSKEGWDMDRFLYEAEATNIMWFDETKPNAQAVLNSLKTQDMSLNKYAGDMLQFLAAIKSEYWESIGVNRQRFGDTNSSDGRGMNQDAMNRSYVISSELFRKFDTFVEGDYNGLLDFSKVAWINGKKGQYMNSDKRVIYLDINGIEHAETEYGVFCSKNRQEAQNLKTLKEYGFAFAQKGNIKPSIVAGIIESKNYSKTKSLIEQAETIEANLIEASKQADRDSNERITQMNIQNDDLNRKVDIYEADRKYQTAIDTTMLSKGYDAMFQGGEDNKGTAENDRIQFLEELDLKRTKLFNDINNNNTKNALAADGNNIKREQIKSAEKIAKQNKNKYDK